ncbi:MAG: septal ring lytic transglycosylase RlpA family protein [Rhizobiales bacterium]|nr:septal ring lytic transglycosylase RlpA family protein [Hyphomicrobiales bacterium]
MGRKGDINAFVPIARVACVAAGCLVLAQCSGKVSGRIDPKYGVAASPRVVEPGQPVPKGGGVYRVGKPYVVAGRTYVPQESRHYRAEGLASWYGEDFHGRLTANGEVFDMHSISAAHPTLPIPSYVRVTNLRNSRSIVARVNDRGPYHGNRVIDVSARTAKLLGFRDHGIARVRVEYVGTASLSGSDDRKLVATLRENGPAPAPSRVMLASAKPFVPRADEPVRRSRGPTPVPQARPFAMGDDDATTETEVASRDTARGQPGELAPAARVARTMGSAPAMTWVTGPSGVPSSGVVRGPEPTSAYAPQGGASFISGRGLY